MNRNLLLAVVAATVALAVAAFVASGNRESAVAQKKEEKLPELLPGVESKLEGASKIVVERKDASVTLERKDGKWTVAENEGFFADEEKIRSILSGFGRFKAIERKTENPELFDKLGVEDPDKEGASSARVTLSDEAGAEIASAVVGRVQSGSGATQRRYVRVPGQDAAWLVETSLAADGDKDSFTLRQIADIEPTRWASFETHSWKTPETVSMDRATSDSKDWRVANIPDGKEITAQSALESFVRPFQRMSHAGVKKTGEFYDQYTSKTLFTGKTWDGLKIDLEMRADSNGDFWAKVVPSVDDKMEGYKEETKAEADKIASVTDGWLFKLSRWHSNSLANDSSSFLKDKPKEPIEASQILVTWAGLESAPEDTTRKQEEAKARADELLAKVRENPDSFADIAKAESDDADTKENGGALGEFAPGLFEEAFDKAAFDLKPGEISEVVETTRGYHILKRTK